MNKHYQKNVVKALLFANGEPVHVLKFMEILEIDKQELSALVDELSSELENDKSGILIKRINDSYQFCTNPIYYQSVRELFEKRKTDTLSRAAYETLAIIAYNKQATRARIEAVRGNSDSPIKTLLERGLIIEAGRLDAPGRPVLYKPAEEFFRAFDVDSLDELIPIEDFEEPEFETASQETEEPDKIEIEFDGEKI